MTSLSDASATARSKSATQTTLSSQLPAGLRRWTRYKPVYGLSVSLDWRDDAPQNLVKLAIARARASDDWSGSQTRVTITTPLCGPPWSGAVTSQAPRLTAHFSPRVRAHNLCARIDARFTEVRHNLRADGLSLRFSPGQLPGQSLGQQVASVLPYRARDRRPERRGDHREQRDDNNPGWQPDSRSRSSQTSAGIRVATVTVAPRSRVQDGASGERRDDETLVLRCSVWRRTGR